MSNSLAILFSKDDANHMLFFGRRAEEYNSLLLSIIQRISITFVPLAGIETNISISFLIFSIHVLVLVMLKESISTQTAIEMLEGREEKLSILKRHTAQKITQIAIKDRHFVFEKLRKKIRDAAEQVAESPLTGDVEKDMSEIASVRREAEALFGTINPEEKNEEQSTGPRSSQLNFLIGVQLAPTVQSHTEKPAQVSLIRGGR